MNQVAVIGSQQKLKELIAARKGQFSEILPPHISIEKFQAAAATAAVVNPSILQCDTISVMTALMKCAADGLVPDNREAALVPFSGRAQYLAMVFGTIKMLRNSNEVASIWAELVYEGEEFVVSVEEGERKFSHKFDPLKRKGEVLGAYAVAKLRDGTIELEAMGVDDIDKRRRASANQRGPQPTGVWKDWWPEMAKKTVIKALAKRLPVSSDDLRRVQEIDEQEAPKDVTPPQTMEERLRAAVAAKAEAIEGEVVPGPAYDDGAVDDMSQAYVDGAKAFADGQGEEMNPYADNPDFSSWAAGWTDAMHNGEGK